MTQQRESMSNVLEEEAKGWGCKREWKVAPERAGRGDGEQGSVQKQHNVAVRQELSAHSPLSHCRKRFTVSCAPFCGCLCGCANRVCVSA